MPPLAFNFHHLVATVTIAVILYSRVFLLPSLPNDISEQATLGRRMYEERIRELVDPAHYGKFCVIDLETGDFEVDKRHILAARKLRERRPGALIFGIRVGFPTAYRMVGAKTLNVVE